MDWRITDPEHLLGALRISLAEGGRYLVGRIAPRGPILRERNLSYVHKASWGMHAAGVDHAIIARLLDWVQKETLQPNGDFYLAGEPPECKDMQRVYRAATFGKVAAWIGHPVIRHARVIDRFLQYQHKPSGGVFHYIGDDPARVEEQAAIGSLNTTFFGHLMIALDMRQQALAAGEWVRRWVDANRPHMAEGRLYTNMTPDGELVTQIGPGEAIGMVVDYQRPRQAFWNVGTAMAYLAVLYDVMRGKWGQEQGAARPYLDAALALLEFESAMPLDTYLWPSKCKVAWGAGELLRVLVESRESRVESQESNASSPPPWTLDSRLLEKTYRVAERVAVFTFLDNQLPGGGWPPMHYPLRTDIPEAAYSYRPLKNTVWIPLEPTRGPSTIYLPSEEITGEFLAEMKSVEQGVAASLRDE